MIDHVAIIGAGFSGTLLAVNLLRCDGPRATLIERAPVAGQGVAYGTVHRDHVLNVRAANMSAFPDEPDHFLRWLEARGVAATGASFVPRAVYGEYLRDLLAAARAAAPGRLAVVSGDAVDVARGRGVRVLLADGGAVAADAAVLAVGNLPPHLPRGLEGAAESLCYRGDPWDPAATAGLGDEDTVLLLGTGLTMVDVALALEARGFGGRIVAVSRRGLVPHRHASSPANEAPIAERPRGGLATLLHRGRVRAEAIGWRNAVDELRPYTQAMWGQADRHARARFLRHLRPWWDVHRHRLAPVVADRIARMIAGGRLTVLAAKPVAAAAVDGGLAVSLRRRGGDVVERIVVRRLVNCTGPQGDLSRTGEPLLATLTARGLIRPDAEHLGIDVDGVARTVAMDGTVDDRLYAIGPMTRGAFWEIVAVPDIRRQAWDLARRLSNAHWVGGEGL
ncbi:FAD-dependent oxidoreductase [Sphingomonas sp. Leaf412]|uniref:FAD/NAD(P)-binding protein n=1 Tax=Sphingomonas sp. Leaf412 TaxID=1736370 RepID=UPI0006F5A0E1|nr:FAD/NAD(P)-binding protein [Sphingomonas sp. Leaf412]KQT35362.1 FAD-dependent oxidoreductase [Sphingomonas sp. Leaf412]